MLELAVIILIFIASYFLILRNFKLSLYVLIILSVLLHKELFSFFKWDLMPVRAFMLALFCAGLTQVYLYIARTRNFKSLLAYLKDPLILILILLWLTRGVSIIFTKNLQASLFLFAFFTTVVVLGIYLYLTFKDTPEELLKYIRFYIYIVFALTLFGIFQYFLFQRTGKIIGALWNIPGKIPRVGSTFWDVNHYGSLIAAVLPILGVFILTDKGIKKKLLNILMFASLSSALVLTNSRTAWMFGGFAFLTFVTVLFFKKFGTKGILYIVLACLLITVPIVVGYNQKKSVFRKEVKAYFHYRIDSYDSHMMLLTGAYQIFEKYPVFGGGYGSFFEHFSKTKTAPTFFSRDPAALNTRVPAHTIWGESLAETGTVGTAVLVLFSFLLLLAPLYVFLNEKGTTSLLGATAASVFVGWYIAGIFYSYNAEFFWLITFFYLIWSIGLIGKDYLSKVVTYFFTSEQNSVVYDGDEKNFARKEASASRPKCFPKSGFLITVVSTLAFCLIFFNLGTNHLIPWDEAIYAKVAKNMVESNQFVVPHWDTFNKGWFEKPPLYMWKIAGLMKLMGYTSLAAKLPSAVFGLLTVALVFILAKKLFNNTTAFISSLAILTSVHFLYYSRASMLDVTVTFFITLALYFYWCSKNKDRRIFWILSGVSTGLAVMTKGFVGLLPFLVIGLYEIYLFIFGGQKLKVRLFLNYLLIFFAGLLVVAPWHIAMYKMFGAEFFNKYFVYHVWDRATMAIEDKGKPFLWYLIVLKVSMRLWFVALLAAFPVALFLAVKKDKRFVFLTIWAVSMFLFFSVAKSKLIWYVIPLYPVLCIMVGYFSERALDFVMRRFKFLDHQIFKFISMYLVVVVSLFYLFLNRQLVYTSDLNGYVPRLLETEAKLFGPDLTVYLDRVEDPTALYYAKSPYVVIDFRADLLDRVPNVPDDQPLVLITKKGRYLPSVAGYVVPSKLVVQDGDWVLWYMPPKVGAFELLPVK